MSDETPTEARAEIRRPIRQSIGLDPPCVVDTIPEKQTENRRRCATSHMVRAVWPVWNGTSRDCR